MDSLIQMLPDEGAGDSFVAVIKVIGVGGGGCNAVEHMISRQTRGVTFIAANTDRQALMKSHADVLIPLGETGLGAGAKPEVGAASAEQAADAIREALEGTNLLFITAGMGGGTGTGAAPVIARIAKSMGILTVGVVTKPFFYEGSRRMRNAEQGIVRLNEHVDSLIIILNDKLEDEVGGSALMTDCFAAANDVLFRACNGIAEIIHTPGLINVDYEDLRTVMSARGTALMGLATAEGPDRAKIASEKAIACPLLEGANLQGAMGLLVYITASEGTMTQSEIRQVMSIMRNFTNPDANVVFGTAFDNNMGDSMRVTVVATGLAGETKPESSIPEVAAPAMKKQPQAQRPFGAPGIAPAARSQAPAAAPATRSFSSARSLFRNAAPARPEPKPEPPVEQPRQSVFVKPVAAPAQPEPAPAPVQAAVSPEPSAVPNAPAPEVQAPAPAPAPEPKAATVPLFRPISEIATGAAPQPEGEENGPTQEEQHGGNLFSAVPSFFRKNRP